MKFVSQFFVVFRFDLDFFYVSLSLANANKNTERYIEFEECVLVFTERMCYNHVILWHKHMLYAMVLIGHVCIDTQKENTCKSTFKYIQLHKYNRTNEQTRGNRFMCACLWLCGIHSQHSTAICKSESVLEEDDYNKSSEWFSFIELKETENGKVCVGKSRIHSFKWAR